MIVDCSGYVRRQCSELMEVGSEEAKTAYVLAYVPLEGKRKGEMNSREVK